jgi:hypothetical protein
VLSSTVSARVEPAGTVKPLMTIVVHLTAAATSLRLEMVPVQRFPIGSAATRPVRARATSAKNMMTTSCNGDAVDDKALLADLYVRLVQHLLLRSLRDGGPLAKRRSGWQNGGAWAENYRLHSEDQLDS